MSSGPCVQVLYLVVGGGYLWFIAQGPGIMELGEVVMWCQESDLWSLLAELVLQPFEPTPQPQDILRHSAEMI